MINALEGIPGSGKSYEAVVYHVLPALQKGRKVITNLPLDVERFAAINPDFRELLDVRKFARPVRGTWDAHAANRGELAFILGETVPAEDVEIFGHVWDFWDEWKGEGGIGPLYVIDECHVSFPRADRSSKGTAKDVIQWFKIHRHYGADVLLMTQNFRDIDQSITSLIATLIKVRKADVLGKKDRYIRKVHSGYRGGLVSSEERPYKAQYFPLYKSHTQGGAVVESVASDVTPFVAKWKRGTAIFWVFALIFLVYAFWPEAEKKPTPFQAELKKVPPGMVLYEDEAGRSAHRRPLQPDGTLHPADQKKAVPDASAAPAGPVEPYKGKTFHLSGWLQFGSKLVYMFEVVANGQRIGTTDSIELAKIGYRYTHLAECAGLLNWHGEDRPITCDAPRLAQGVESKPIVVSEARMAGVAPDMPVSRMIASEQPKFIGTVMP